MLLLALLIGCTSPPVHETLPLATELAEVGTERWPADSQPFDWIPTVWGYGLHRLHHAGGEARWQAWYAAWLEERLDRFTRDPPLPFDSSDGMSPAVLAATLLVEDPDSPVLPIVEAAWRYLDEAPRTQQGAIEHWGPDAPFGVPDQVWIDSQFMFGLFLLREHQRTGDPDALDLWTEQYLLFSELCRDPDTHLYRHAYDDVTEQNIPEEPTFWARGNSWVLISAAEAIDALGVDHPALSEVVPLFQAHAHAVIDAQEPQDGLWRTVFSPPGPTEPANYTETSASALIAYALHVGERSGALDPSLTRPAVAAAVAGVQSRIARDDDAPVVRGTSFGTVPGDYDYYVSVDTRDDLMLGVGAVVMLLAEVDGTPVEAR